MNELKYIGPCIICKAYQPLKATDKWVYHKSINGIVCTQHPGVLDWYNKLLIAAQKQTENRTWKSNTQLQNSTVSQ